jgi:Ca2+:H+ antiporter
MSALTKTERNLIALAVVLTVLAGVVRYVSAVGHIPAFIMAGLALAALAWVISFGTEQFGAHFGAAITGVMQAIVGNVPEFFVVLFALQSRDVVVAKTALLGSIMVNALLILGLVLMTGSYKSPDGVMRFSPKLPKDTATLLLSASFMIVLVGVANSEHSPSSRHADAISVIGSVVMIIVYGIWMWRYLRTDGDAEAAAESPPDVGVAAERHDAFDAEPPRLSKRACLMLLILAGVGAAFVSDWFVHSLEPTIHSLGISQAFAGLVIVAIAGNAVEHVVGIYLAYKGRNDLAVSVVQNSVGQIIAFMYPLMVIVSLFTAGRLTFVLDPVYIAALIGTAVLIWQITGDGEATMFEGAAMAGLFVVLAVIAFYQH